MADASHPFDKAQLKSQIDTIVGNAVTEIEQIVSEVATDIEAAIDAQIAAAVVDAGPEPTQPADPTPPVTVPPVTVPSTGFDITKWNPNDPSTWLDADPSKNSNNPNDGDPAHHPPGWTPTTYPQSGSLPAAGGVGSDQPTPAPAPVPGAFKQTRPFWISHDWVGNVHDSVLATCAKAKNDGQTPVLIPYDIPGRDNGNYSSGGQPEFASYNKFISDVADAITVPSLVFLEPDAMGLSENLPADKKAERRAALLAAAIRLRRNPNATVYLVLSMWSGADHAIEQIKPFIGIIDGFITNVSDFQATAEVYKFADEVAKVTGLHYLIDTSRNGNGQPHPGKWCNPTDVKIGAEPTLDIPEPATHPYCIGFVHAKVAGESDGKGINDDGSRPRDDVPSAGTWWPEYAAAITSGDWFDFKKKYNVA